MVTTWMEHGWPEVVQAHFNGDSLTGPGINLLAILRIRVIRQKFHGVDRGMEQATPAHE